ncbi:PIH1 domain-containing protein 1 isoform X2 [Harpegnathos saltator]|uniref:PIH1 domain-containing protein 1 isoform X2 n=1 Tax=Harpegnathos saltator TaxID=610380 RepID=UPI000DBEEA43|nr:PIH1 domain-containing protein 1 isoform X2 [Harpegnathos saltator]
MNDTTFLDIDESLKTKNLLLPDEKRDALNNKMDEWMKQLDPTPSILVQPMPGICVKTKTTSGEKVFLNICTSDKIPAPIDIPDEKLLQLLDNDEPAYSIPMSIGTERMETDKYLFFLFTAGAPCMTFDIMINTIYFKKCCENKNFMTFTILIILSGVSDKYNKDIVSANYVILKNRTVMGKLQQHKILCREPKKPESYKPLIEEMSQPKKVVDKKVDEKIDEKVCLQKTDKAETGFMILRYPLEDPVERIIALFEMPRSVSTEDIVVLINSGRINVTDEKAYCSHDILLPYAVKASSAKAYLDYNLRMLRVDVLVE